MPKPNTFGWIEDKVAQPAVHRDQTCHVGEGDSTGKTSKLPKGSPTATSGFGRANGSNKRLGLLTNGARANIGQRLKKGLGDWLATLVRPGVTSLEEREALIPTNKMNALRELMDCAGVPQIVASLLCGVLTQLKHLVPIVESDALRREITRTAEIEGAFQLLQSICGSGLEQKLTGTFQSDELWVNVVRALRIAYSRHYTTEDIKDLTCFYKSPAGKKFLRVQSHVEKEVLDELQRTYGAPMLQQIRAEVERVVRNMTTAA